MSERALKFGATIFELDVLSRSSFTGAREFRFKLRTVLRGQDNIALDLGAALAEVALVSKQGSYICSG